jgi:cyclic-di-AMP phosphodiesterase PgpH
MNLSLPDVTVDRWRPWIRRYALPIFIGVLILGMTVILSIDLPGSTQVEITVGQPAPNDVFSPRSLTYTSELLTRQAREQASRAVADIYTPLDLGIGRSQLANARDMFAFIETVRADSSASPGRRLAYLQAIESISIDEDIAQGILGLSQSDYDEVKANILGIIEDLMREEIRPSQLG